MENQLDALHPSVTHQSTGISAGRVEKRLQGRAGRGAAVLPLPVDVRVELRAVGRRADDQLPARPRHPEGLHGPAPAGPGHARVRGAAEAGLRRAAKTEEYLSRSIHHVLVYPYLSVQSPLQQLRCLRPIGPDKTLSEIWHFRLKGAPEAIYRRSLWYYNLVNSPATMINADDLENWTKGQWGLQSNGGDWVSFHRYFGDDREEDGVDLLEPRHVGGGDAQPVPAPGRPTCRPPERTQEQTMANANDNAPRSIPSAGPDFEHLLAQEVVIEGGEGARRTGAQAVEPDHSPRTPLGDGADDARRLPRAGLVRGRRGRRPAARGRAVPLPAGRAARRQALAGVDRSVRRRRACTGCR